MEYYFIIYLYAVPQININTDAFVVMARKLEQIHRSSLPVAVRQTLNDAAFDVKGKTLQESANKNFIRRSPNFFKTFSGVNKATGFNINAMKAEVGMTDQGKTSARAAITHMDAQEQGGNIKGGGDYLKDARAGSNRRRVAQANYFKKGNLVTGAFSRPGTAKSNFVAAASVALMQGKSMFINTPRGKFLISVTAISAFTKTRGLKITTKILMMDRKNVTINATHFSSEAAAATMVKIPTFYQKEAEKQFNKIWKN